MSCLRVVYDHAYMHTRVPPLRLLLVDNSQLYLDAAINALTTDPRLEVVDRAFSGQEGIALVSQRQPDGC